MTSLEAVLDRLTVKGELYEALADHAVRCVACGHRCLIREGRRGICGVRFNRMGELFVPHGYVAALQSDPIEKKPFSHVLPGVHALTFGMLGCDYHCPYCQNWFTSQVLRDPASAAAVRHIRECTPQMIAAYARQMQAAVVVSSYNEPLITSEWAVDVFKEAKASGFLCAYVSNGNNTPEVIRYLAPYLDAYKVDLKCMDDKKYRTLGGTLQNTLDGIKRAREAGLWVEVVTLVVPGFNDSNDELWDAARFLAGLSVDIPWHVTAFHNDYKMTTPGDTDAQTLIRAAEVGREAGLRYVYAGNLPGHVGEYEDTPCPRCGYTVVERRGYILKSYQVTGAGSCPKCGEAIAGVWHSDPKQASTGNFGHPLPVW